MITSGRLRVAVVGCGIGGASTALFLGRAGHETVVFERSPQVGATGAGILLAPTGQYVLDKLGLLQEALEHGSRVQRLEGVTAGGRKIMDLRYRLYGTGLFGLGIHRGTLFTILHEALRSARIPIQTGREAISVENGTLRFADGASAGPFDLIVVADGARSTLRKALGLQAEDSEYPYGALWVSATNWGELPDNVLRQAYRGTRRMAGLLPSGRLPGSSGRQISLFWSIAMKDVPNWREAGLEAWKESVMDLIPAAASLMDQIESVEQVTVAAYQDMRAWSTVKDGCVLLGDAAHASSPQLGQGASLALFDAYTLAQCLARERHVTPALMTYSRLRSRHTQFYQRASKLMTPLFQSGYEFLAWPRDLLMGPVSHIPWVQHQMIATMAGVKQGVRDSIPQEAEVLRMGARFAFGAMVQPEPEPTAVLRW